MSEVEIRDDLCLTRGCWTGNRKERLTFLSSLGGEAEPDPNVVVAKANGCHREFRL